ncbi:MAG: tripartite tricarboxylate transporter substrate binding protein [Hyphomicrobiales bacterium]|nr:tripartite tricarboxylate transporter substrate binding protein [Hyphomicrobiales bacterium]
MKAFRSKWPIPLAVGVAFLFPSYTVQAQKISSRTMTFVVPTTPGTSMDFLARLIAQEMKNRWDQTAVVENKAGASHTIAIQMVVRSQPDGLTLLSAANTLTTNVGFFKVMPYDPVNSLTPVIEMARGSLALAVHPSVPAKSVAELAAYAKERPGELNYGTPGPGTPQHLATELLAMRAGIKMTHVPYPGSAGAARDLVGGHIKIMFIPSHQAIPLARSDKIRLLAVSGSSRLAQVPDVATLTESGFEGVDVDSWYGLLGPAGTPANIVGRINGLVNEMLRDPKYQQALDAQGLRPTGGTPEAFAQLIKADVDRWTKVVREAGIETK